jgi:hypothetical protein
LCYRVLFYADANISEELLSLFSALKVKAAGLYGTSVTTHNLRMSHPRKLQFKSSFPQLKAGHYVRVKKGT